MERCSACCGSPSPVPEKPRLPGWVEQLGEDGSSAGQPLERRSLFEAQVYAVSYCHLYLPMYPVAWITRKTAPQFLHFYIRFRTKYNTLKLLASLVGFCGLWPWLYASAAVSNPCVAADFRVVSHGAGGAGVPASLTLQKQGCDFQRWIHSPAAILPIGLLTTACTLGLFVVVVQLAHANPILRNRLLLHFKSVLPRIFYNGLGQIRTEHGAWNLFKQAGMERHWSVLHDFFGTTDYIIFVIVVGVSSFAVLVALSCYKGGAQAIPIAAVLGVGAVRIEILLMNYVLGAQDSLIAAVKIELTTFAPFRRFIRVSDGSIKEDRIAESVSRACSVLRRMDHPNVELVVERIRTYGPRLLMFVIRWLVTNDCEYANMGGVCYRLFRCDGESLGATEYEVASLSLLDTTSFLTAFFDPGLTISGEAWGRSFILRNLYNPFPNASMATLSRDRAGRWLVETECDIARALAADAQGAEECEAGLSERAALREQWDSLQ